MDLQRSLLIGAIAVLSFMLLTEWVAFKEEKTAAANQTSRIISNDDSPRSSNLPELPSEDTPADSDEIPTAPGMDQPEPAAPVAGSSGGLAGLVGP